MLDVDYLFTNKFLNTFANDVVLIILYRSLNNVINDSTKIRVMTI